ncbi:Uncharacterised protein [Mycobacterium tuberculosis]|uniref:Uncharacterized protein n=1 Tax=Mycobacterium tuberculosis TaxID=1773 RepID=A0A916LI18_MYCTX|nr:Uncharacterised protein [Mycobacterium tuberculosis]CNN21399.1 Uncharacterised protein [Mycobacterium tuberculosis]CPA40245.1 Uncharacterised protein [Mycobacterium tuberculosis]CPB17170.1 Uncharacterised protein [Mycobacterium tuberculosis]CPB46400.1 Uncharacterised protein [Mycobacterium tuberculosis]
MFSPTISSSDIWSRCLTSARNELPWATISTVLPTRKSPTMTSVKYGKNRATTSARHSVSGPPPMSA